MVYSAALRRESGHVRTVICIPTYNERENLPALVEEIVGSADASVLIIDDDSPDGTGHAADLLAKKHARVSVIHRSGRGGMAGAYIEGFQRALREGFEIIFQMDADFSHQPRYLPKMIEVLKTADVVVGSRYVDGGGIGEWGLGRRVLSRSGNLYARGVLGMPIRDATAGYVGYRRHVLEAIDLATVSTEDYAFQVELKYRVHKLGFEMVEVPILFWDRVVGSSKLTQEGAVRSAWRVLKLRLKDR